MFGKFLIHAPRQCGGLKGEHSTLVHWGSNSIWHAKKAKVSLVLNEQKPNRIALHSNSNTTFKHAPSQVERKYWIFLPKNQWENLGPPTKSPIRSQENSNVELNHQIGTCELLNNSHDNEALKFDGFTYTSWRQKSRGHTTWWMCNGYGHSEMAILTFAASLNV